MIREVQIRRFRSIAAAGLSSCGGLNVLIGRNNAGKSNILNAIELALGHLRAGRIAGPWATRRPVAEFTNRDNRDPLRLAIEFDLPKEINAELRERLVREVPHLERSIDQIAARDRIVFVVAGATTDTGEAYLFVEQIGVGRLTATDRDVDVDGIRILSVSRMAAVELYRNFAAARTLGSHVEAFEGLRMGSAGRYPPLEYLFEQPKEVRGRFAREWGAGMPADAAREIGRLLSVASSADELRSQLAQLVSETRDRIDAVARKDTEAPISAFAGETHRPPTYAEWLVSRYGAIQLLHLFETRQQIGAEEAESLLSLKTKRGGPGRLTLLQQTIRTLLGVNVDAFEAEPSERRPGQRRGPDRGAEMDVDDFLVEANGAGIREALRIILDLELKSPQVVLIEEPEVHLHPGLVRVMAEYLRSKSSEIQMFLSTHSTECVDSVSFKNVYLVTRGPDRGTCCEAVEDESGALKIPGELGLRLSTVFMFDRLVFVEGPSDETVLRRLAGTLEIELARKSVGFVYMRGVRNFAHFAAEGTLDLLSRRRIEMWFLTDRDERDDEDVAAMMARLGGRASLVVLSMRELENYLIEPRAIAGFIRMQRGGAGEVPDEESIRRAILEEANGLKEEVIRLRLEVKVLRPVFLHTRRVEGTIEERIRVAVEDLARRRDGLQEDEARVRANVEEEWGRRSIELVPGARLLSQVMGRFGARFSKERGDSEHIAGLLDRGEIDREVREFLLQVGR